VHREVPTKREDFDAQPTDERTDQQRSQMGLDAEDDHGHAHE
jgi:hypothetical protein